MATGIENADDVSTEASNANVDLTDTPPVPTRAVLQWLSVANTAFRYYRVLPKAGLVVLPSVIWIAVGKRVHLSAYTLVSSAEGTAVCVSCGGYIIHCCRVVDGQVHQENLKSK